MKATRMFLLMFCAVCAAMSASAEPEPQQSGAPSDGVVMATQRSDGSTNTWTLAELQDALGLMNRKYWRDMKTAQGRREWHGSVAGSFMTTNAAGVIERVDLHEDGYVHREEPTRKVVITDPEAIAKAAAERETKIRELESRTLPPEIAAILAARRAAATTNEVTVTVTP